jgi:hypothetical protein
MDHAAIKRRKRGEASKDDLARFSLFSEPKLLSLLRSEKPVERTCAAIHLHRSPNPNAIDELCEQLSIEKQLYPKLAMCEVLAECAELSIKPLIALLGKIGNNHETKIPETGFYKVSYPLPRDISARTICRFGSVAILPLEKFIETSKNNKAISQAIDAYGHILYTNKIERSSAILQNLNKKYPENDFLKYKIAQCLSGFHDEWAKDFLLETLHKGCNGLRLGALRSLTLLKIEPPKNIKEKFTAEMQKLELFIKKR